MWGFFQSQLKRATRFDGEELAREGCSLGNITETFMVMEATLIISQNLSNSDMRRKRETLKSVMDARQKVFKNVPQAETLNLQATTYT